MHEKQRTLGAFLREERELRQIPLSEVARETKVPLASLELLEAGEWDELPAEIFVRGFVRSYARYLGIPADEVNGYYREAIAADKDAAARLMALNDEPWAPEEGTEVGGERKFGLALVVIIVLIIATITLSLLWRKGAGASSHSSLTPQPAQEQQLQSKPPVRLS